MRNEAQVPPAQKVYYEELFQIADADKDGVVGLSDASFFRNSMLSNEVLRDIWQLSDVNNGYLNIEDFFVALKLVSLAQMGAPVTLDSIKLIPVIPPPKLNDIPPLKNDWIIGNSEKQNYIDLFNKYDEDSDGFILGTQAKTIFGTSGLPTKMLSHIWNLSDVGKDQKLDCQEFIIATFLIRSVLKGYELPNKLPESLVTSSHYISSAGVPSPKIPEWLIPPPERVIYEDLFNKNQQGGIFTGSQAKVLFEKSGLSNQDLKLIWDLADYNQEQVLDKHKFVIAMFLISQRKKGKELPQTLPQLLMESSKSTFNPSSITSPPPQSSPQSISSSSQQQQQQVGDSKYNINLNELVSNTSSIGQPNIQPNTTATTTTTTTNIPATASGGLNVSGLVSQQPPSQQQQSPSIGGTPPLTREGSFTFDNSGTNNNLLAKPPRSNSITRMNSFQQQQQQQQPQQQQQQVSPQSTISNNSIGSGSFLSTNATTSSPLPPSVSSQSTTSNSSSITNNNPTSPTSTNITQLFENIEKVKQQVFEQERIRQEEIQVKLNQELQLEAELKQQLSQEQQQLDEIRENVKAEETKLSTIKAGNQSLKEQISAARVDIKSLKSHLEQQSSLLREKSELSDEQNEALSHLNDDLKDKKQELEKNKQQIEQLLSSIESIKQNRNDIKNQISIVTKQLNDSKLELKQLTEEQKQQKQKLAEEQKQLQQQQQQQQTTSKSLTSVKSDDNITFLSSTTNITTTTSIPTASVSGNDSWDFFNSPPVKSSSSLPTSPFDDDNKTFIPTVTTTTNIGNNINTSNGNLTFSSPIKSTVNQLKSSNSSVGGTGGSVTTRKLSGASVSSVNSFNDNTSIDTLNNHFGSDQFSFNSFGTNNLTSTATMTTTTTTTGISNTTNKVQTDFFGSGFSGNKDPFGDSNNNPFGEESTSSIKDGGSETLSEAHTLFDKDPLFETNDAFQSSKDPFGQILFSNFSKDSFGGESVSNNSNSINSAPSTFALNTTSSTNNNRQSSPIDSDLFSSQQPTTTAQSNQNNQSFTSNDSFDDFQTTTTTATTTNDFGVKFNDTTFGGNSNGGFDFGGNIFGQSSGNDPFSSSSIESQQPQDINTNTVSSDPFKGGFDDFGAAPFSFDNKFNEVVGENSPSLTTDNNNNNNDTFAFNNNNAPSPFDS
ncbi:hypothetical protein RB653_008005 [Dictyostelium firmibasis]|uniref:Epidermal growth factor receptor substrate 15-like 1 n=1 Tax=Dictyostelium firmibasis TaxID=79012 RepID=A0AAN7TZN3_9MYCE